MKRLLLLAVLLASSFPLATPAQVDMRIHVGLPAVPPLVVVQPGVQVVENYDEEVFYTGGWYWVRRHPHWYRARTPHAAFVMVEPRHVPATLVRYPPGHYRHWRKQEVKEARREAKAERKAWKDHERDERHHGRGHGHGHGG